MHYTRLTIATLILLAIAYGHALAQGPSRGALALTPADMGKPVTLYQKSYALVIGIDSYTEGWPRLSNAIKDAKAVAQELAERGFDVTTILDPKATELRLQLEKFVILKGKRKSDRLFIWFAGHGHTINGEGYLVPADAPKPEDDEFRLEAYSLRNFGRLMREARAKHVLTVFDSCFAGTVFNSARSKPPDAITRATTLPARQFVSSGDAEQKVSDDGTFRKLFLAALKGDEPIADANNDGYITGTELGLFLSDKVTNLSGKRQTPRYGKLTARGMDRGDFVFAVPSNQPTKSPKPLSAEFIRQCRDIGEAKSPAILSLLAQLYEGKSLAACITARRSELSENAKATAREHSPNNGHPTPGTDEHQEGQGHVRTLDGRRMSTSPLEQASKMPFGLSSFFNASSASQAANQRTRITIDLRRRSKFEIFSLNNPNRVVIELPQEGMRLPRLPRSRASGLVKNLRASRYAPGRSRIVIDVSEPVVVEKSQIDVHKSGRGAQLELVLVPFRVTSRTQEAALKRGPSYGLGGGSLTQPPVPRRAADRGGSNSDYKPLIVIDPGHGGEDSGAKKFGANEKDVVLAFGRTLRDRLLKTGRYRVKMTRSTDVFISLEKRRDFAEDNAAALFITVHADYAGSKTQGATIYSLRKKLADRLRRAAASDAARNAMSSGVMKHVSTKTSDLRTVRGILGDLAQREVHATLERTNVFTQIAISHMGATTTMRSKPHREAAFQVLKTAKVPTVLVELAYVSNRRDAARLQSQKWRNQVSSSLVKSIDTYFSHVMSHDVP
jgi:N-acetylmuramoyl-L-alanine amidase